MARRRRMRWVIDTLVVIRGARAFRQQPPVPTTPELRLLLGWIDDATQFDWLFSPPILEEYRAVLRRLKVPVHAVGRFLNLLRQAGIEVEARNLGSFSPDPDDDPFGSPNTNALDRSFPWRVVRTTGRKMPYGHRRTAPDSTRTKSPRL